MFSFNTRVTSKPIRIFVDGSNYAGKSSICTLLRSMFPGITIVELHDFCHLHLMRQLGLAPEKLHLPRHWRQLEAAEVETCRNYLEQREKNVLSFIGACGEDDILCERMPLTRWVYLKLLFGAGYVEPLGGIVEELRRLSAIVLFVTASESEVLKRSRSQLTQRPERQSPEIPFHLIRSSSIREKRKLYEKAFRLLPEAIGLRVDTTGITRQHELAKLLTDRLGYLQR